LKKAELNYTITEKECLSVVFGVKENRIYLYGVDFTAITDHGALVYMLTIKSPIGRLARWIIFLQVFSGMTVVHRAGVKHGNVDAMSRPVIDTITVFQINISSFNTDVYDNLPLMHYVQQGVHAQGLTRSQIERVESDAKHYKSDQYCIWYRKLIDDIKYLRVPRPEERVSLIEKAHVLGHFQTQAT